MPQKSRKKQPPRIPLPNKGIPSEACEISLLSSLACALWQGHFGIAARWLLVSHNLLFMWRSSKGRKKKREKERERGREREKLALALAQVFVLKAKIERAQKCVGFDGCK